MITVGSIVSLNGRRYKVDQVQFRGDRVVPLVVRMIGGNGTIDSYQHKDTNEAWFKHPWVLIETPIPVDPRAKIIAKIKYLDEKFKKAQEKKAAAKQSEAMAAKFNADDLVWRDTSVNPHASVSANPASFIRTTSSTSTPMTYNEFMEYYNSMVAERIRATPF